MNLDQAYGLHATASRPINVFNQDSAGVNDFRMAVSQLRKFLGDYPDVTLENFLYQVSVTSFELYFNPTPYENNDNLQSLLRDILQNSSNIRDSVDKDSSSYIVVIEKLCRLFLDGEQNSLFIEFDRISKLETSSNQILVIVKNGRIRKSFQDYLNIWENGPNVKVVLPGEIPSLKQSFSSCFLFGDPGAYDGIERFICAVNSMNTGIITYGTQMRNIQGLFSDLAEKAVIREFQFSTASNSRTSLVLSKQELDLYLGKIDNQFIESTIRTEIAGISEIQGETIECYSFLLSGDYIFFIPVPRNDEVRVMVDVLRPDENFGQRVQRVEVVEIDTDSIVLTRRGQTATEAIIPLANEIMGSSSFEHRGNQALWKNRLRERILELGSEKVRSHLKELDVKNPYINSWQKQDTMRPKSDVTFMILLEYLDFNEKQKKILFASARIVNSAHIAAGHEFLKRLKDAFENVPASQIYGEGIVDKNINADGKVATLSAIVCLGRLDGTKKVPEELIRRPILLSRGVAGG